MSYFDYWGKAGQAQHDARAFHLLAYHCLDVAACAERILSSETLWTRRLDALLPLGRAALIRLFTWLVALHDVGKMGAGFQGLRPDLRQRLRGLDDQAPAYQPRHDALGRVLMNHVVMPEAWRRKWLVHGSRDCGRGLVRQLLVAVTGHHGQPACGSRGDMAVHIGAQERADLVAFSEETWRLLCTEPITLPQREDEEHADRAARLASWFVAGLTVLADWLGSNEAHFAWVDRPMPIEAYWTEHALPQADRAIRSSGVLGCTPAKRRSFSGLLPHLAGKTPTATQVACCDLPISQEPQLVLIEDVTGSGKTEAALMVAHRMMAAGAGEAIYVALPTMATANQMYDRVARTYRRLFDDDSRPSLVLAHGSRDLSEPFRASIPRSDAGRSLDERYGADEATAEAQCSAWLADSRKRALLAHVGVGTVDQALLSILPVKFQSLRLLGLSRAILIADEIHAYDGFTGRLLEGLLETQAALGGSAVLLSATLPGALRDRLTTAFVRGARPGARCQVVRVAYPLVTRVAPLSGEMEEIATAEAGASGTAPPAHTTVVERIDCEQTALDALERAAKAERCACWIRNTVDDAVRAWEELRVRLGPHRVTLFHARFAVADRQRIEERVLAAFGKAGGATERAGRVVVATQVLEQSLDLDFDTMVTDLAPIDLLVQRAGRLHRHRRRFDGTPCTGADQRPDAPLLVLSPPPIDDPGQDWYSAMFPSGQYVYPSPGLLWRTARVLERRGAIVVPEQARALVEEIYGEAAEPVPEALEIASELAEQMRRDQRVLAHAQQLGAAAGYGDVSQDSLWRADEVAVTRLGEPTVTVRVGRLEEDRVRPWVGGNDGWRLSELDVPRRRLRRAVVPAERTTAVDRACAAMPDRGKWSVLVPFSPLRDGTWEATVEDDRERTSTWSYSAETGLRHSAKVQP